ncbi:MAG TPA: EutP/PduV family microcompartment system protein [Candidatus Pelethocola excrementipullorum]|nr:EutP/PduV family microcompartment system protein [Candidatus Pelethocola excrementipullorum]
MKKVIFIGQSGSGKTTLCQKLNEQSIRYRKTQAVEHYGTSIDTPGEYLENRRFYNALIMTAVDAEIIALVADPTSDYRAMPPGFGGIFGKKVIGIITKIHQVRPERIKEAERELTMAQASPIFQVDTPEGEGIEELEKYLREEAD